MKITIGLPTYDDYSGVEMTLQSLLMHHDLTDVELLVVDNHPVAVKDPHGHHVESEPTRKLRLAVEAAGARWIPLPSPTGTAPPRNKIFDEAAGDVVIVADSHVLFSLSVLPAVRDFFKLNPDSRDILTGPLLSRRRLPGRATLPRSRGREGEAPAEPSLPRPQPMATHYADVWRKEMWGIWSQAWQCRCGQFHFDVNAVMPPEQPELEVVDGAIATAPPQVQRTPVCTFHRVAMGHEIVRRCPVCKLRFPRRLDYSKHHKRLEKAGHRRRCWGPDDVEPFEIPGLGLGMFCCRRDVWPRFPDGMIGFGGGELHMHELFRRNGGRALCHPLMGWWHRFERDRVPYPLQLWHKVRNYVIWRRHLDMPLDPVYDHFVNNPDLPNPLNQSQWEYLLADPYNRTEWPAHLATPQPRNSRPQPPDAASSIDQVYHWIRTTKRDCIQHLPTIRELASRSDVVVSLVKRREWDVAALAGLAGRSRREGEAPAEPSYISHNTEPDAIQSRLQKLAPYTLDHIDSLAADPVDNDLLIIDTVHSADRLRGELARWLPHCRRWIALRGTKTFGERAEGKTNQPGLLVAARELCEQHPEWKRVYQDDRQYGLTVLSCDPDERTIDRGPGYELHEIFDGLGVEMQAGCACRQRIKQMNAWGAAGCREHIDEIVDGLKQDQSKYSWGIKFKAAIGTVKSGIAFKLNPLDPLPGLVKEAIRRTEADDEAWEARGK